jgi:hypothetical protein
MYTQDSISYRLDGVQHRTVIVIDWTVYSARYFCYRLDGVEHRTVLVIDRTVYSTEQY